MEHGKLEELVTRVTPGCGSLGCATANPLRLSASQASEEGLIHVGALDPRAGTLLSAGGSVVFRVALAVSAGSLPAPASAIETEEQSRPL